MAAAFVLNSDKQFITPFGNGEGLTVQEYIGADMNDLHKWYGKWWSYTGASIGPTETQYKALQLFGATVEGDKLRELAGEIRGIETGNNVLIYVNRLGMCLMTQIKHPSVKAMRINDYFGWSKYGVRVPRGVSTSAAAWNKADMFTGETVVDVGGLAKAAEEAKELRLSLEEKSIELTICKIQLELMMKNQSLWSKLVEDKEKLVEDKEIQLRGFKAALREALG